MNRYPKKNDAIRYMVKGLIAQLMIKVRITGFGVFAAETTWAKSIFTMMGYIMKNRHTAMGIDTRYMESESSFTAISGAILPKAMPAPMQTRTQRVKYFSKMDNFFSGMIITHNGQRGLS
ncbi:hypothetical protein ES703_81441 [subsurface metagenome]